jgi:verruculogen synthase
LQRFNHDLDGIAKVVPSARKFLYYDDPMPKTLRWMSYLPVLSKTFRHDILNNTTLHRVCEIAFKETGDYWMITGTAMEDQPGDRGQSLHRDEATHPVIHHMPLSAPLLSISWITAVTDFTEENGATRLILGSHKWATKGDPPEELTVRASMKAGDVLLMHQGMVHGGGAHRGEEARRLLLTQMASCQLAQTETFLSAPRSIIETMTPLAQKMIGWRTTRPLPTNINGLMNVKLGLLEDDLELKSNQPDILA